jgi:hypothetical protein
VARVQAAAEGEMNHHRDGCDDADDRSHGRCLCFPYYRSIFPGNSSVKKGRLGRGRSSLPDRASWRHDFHRVESRCSGACRAQLVRGNTIFIVLNPRLRHVHISLDGSSRPSTSRTAISRGLRRGITPGSQPSTAASRAAS